MKKVFIFAFIILSMAHTKAQERSYLYPAEEKHVIGGSKHLADAPYFEHFRPNPDSANGAAILICPGGAYTNLADQHEGKDIALFFNKQGFDAFVLHYRLNDFEQSGSRYPAQYNDVTRAMRMIKSRAKDWKIDPERIGVIGFSAGGHLASCLGTMILPGNQKAKEELEKWSTRPAFMVLVYPVIAISTKYGHKYSTQMLLGPNPDPALLDSLSTEKRVTALTPPTFIVYSNDDPVLPENGILFYEALRRENVPAEMHIYGHGGHGYGMAPQDPVLNTWPSFCISWLKRQGFCVKHP